jgi:hypothetical protein
MYRNEPRAQYIGQMVQYVRVCDAVDSSIRGDREKEDIGEERVSGLYTRDHATSAQGFDEKDERHNRQDVVMGRKRRPPMNSEISHPDDKDRKVDW